MMRELSIRSPWWWAILHAGKDIENRDWPTRYRGRVLIHASKWFGRQDIIDDMAFIRRASGTTEPPVMLGDFRTIGGHLVGTVEIVDCVEQSASPWFFGRYGFVLRNPEPLDKPILCRGALGFFAPEARP
jgi:hypothetical protein